MPAYHHCSDRRRIQLEFPVGTAKARRESLRKISSFISIVVRFGHTVMTESQAIERFERAARKRGIAGINDLILQTGMWFKSACMDSRSTRLSAQVEVGSELVSVTFADWAEQHNVQLEFINPTRSVQNGFRQRKE